MTRLKQTEAQFQDVVLELARINGWRYTHFRPGMNRRGQWSTPLQGHPGWPDIVLVRPPRALFCEIKSENGRLSEDQRLWIDALRGCGLDVRVWFPSDFDEIVSTLGKGRAA